MSKWQMNRRRLVAAMGALGVGAAAPRPARAIECTVDGAFGAYETVSTDEIWRVEPESRTGLYVSFLGPQKRTKIDIGLSARAGFLHAARTTGDLQLRLRFPSGDIITRPVAITVLDNVGSLIRVDPAISYGRIAQQDERIFELIRTDPFVLLQLASRRMRVNFYEDEQSLEGAGAAIDFAAQQHRQVRAASDCEGGFCFLTTACCAAVGLRDDCWELTTARRFRDQRLAATPEGRAEIRAYYALAPRIVAAVDAKPDALTIWRRLYASQIVPICALAAAGAEARAHRLYRRMVERLAATHL